MQSLQSGRQLRTVVDHCDGRAAWPRPAPNFASVSVSQERGVGLTHIVRLAHQPSCNRMAAVNYQPHTIWVLPIDLFLRLELHQTATRVAAELVEHTADDPVYLHLRPAAPKQVTQTFHAADGLHKIGEFHSLDRWLVRAEGRPINFSGRCRVVKDGREFVNDPS